MASFFMAHLSAQGRIIRAELFFNTFHMQFQFHGL